MFVHNPEARAEGDSDWEFVQMLTAQNASSSMA